jgi:hypothetical protein
MQAGVARRSIDHHSLSAGLAFEIVAAQPFSPPQKLRSMAARFLALLTALQDFWDREPIRIRCP